MNPLFRNRVISADTKATAIYVPLEPTANGREIANRIRQLLPKSGDGDQYFLAGDPIARDTFGYEMFQQMALFSPVAGMPYDHLVVALGADLAPDAVPGLASPSHTFFAFDGSVRLRDALQAFSGVRITVVVSAMPYKCSGAPHEGGHADRGFLPAAWPVRQSGDPPVHA